MKRLIELIAYSNVWISLGAVCFTYLFYFLSEVPVDFTYLLFIFCSTLLTYTFQRYMKLVYKENIVGPRMLWMQENKTIVKLILIIGLGGTIYGAISLRLESIILLAAMGIISFLYAFKVGVAKSKRTNLRDISGIKIFLIALVWTVSSAVIPALQANILNGASLLLSVGFFMFIVGITIPFDIRDLDYDEEQKRTIPQVFGEGTSKIIAAVLLLISYLCFAFPDFNNFSLMVGIGLSVILVLFSNKNRNELFFSFILDGLLVLLPLSVYLLHNL